MRLEPGAQRRELDVGIHHRHRPLAVFLVSHRRNKRLAHAVMAGEQTFDIFGLHAFAAAEK